MSLNPLKKATTIALLDVLGFKEFVRNNSVDVVEEKLDKLQLFCRQAFSNDFLPSFLDWSIISDTILVWVTEDVGFEDYFDFFRLLGQMMKWSLQEGFPLRGAVAYGELLVKEGTPKIIIGPALIDAYEGQEELEFCGVVLLESECAFLESAGCLGKLAARKVFTYYEVPKKGGCPVKEEAALCWWDEPFSEDAIRRCFHKSGEKHKWAVEVKIRNTVEFVRQCQQD